MRFPTIAAGAVACMATVASAAAATALTYKLVAGEKACFYTETTRDNEKVAFYFSVGSPMR